jgi:hypothetical protein
MNASYIKEHIIFPLESCHIQEKYHIYDNEKESIEFKTGYHISRHSIQKKKYRRIEKYHWEYQ